MVTNSGTVSNAVNSAITLPALENTCGLSITSALLKMTQLHKQQRSIQSRRYFASKRTNRKGGILNKRNTSKPPSTRAPSTKRLLILSLFEISPTPSLNGPNSTRSFTQSTTWPTTLCWLAVRQCLRYLVSLSARQSTDCL